MESVCFIIQKDKNPLYIFTGDTLFLGDAGRPDLSVDPNIKWEDLASLLFDSLNRLKSLPGNIVIFPGHGAGSPCGKNI